MAENTQGGAPAVDVARVLALRTSAVLVAAAIAMPLLFDDEAPVSRLSDVKSPPPGATCRDAVLLLQRLGPRHELDSVVPFLEYGMVADVAPNVYLNAGPDFFPRLDEKSPFDFEIIVEGSQTRNEFLERQAQVESWLNAWLKPSGLVVGEFFVLWEAEPPLRHQGPVTGDVDVIRDPRTGRVVDQRLKWEERVKGSLCQIEHALE